MEIFVSNVIAMVISCTPLQFLLNDKTKKKCISEFLSFSIEDDRYVHCYYIGLYILFNNNMFVIYRENIIEFQEVGVVAVQFE